MLLSASWVTTPIVNEVQKVSGKAGAQQNNVSATTLCYSTPEIATPRLDRLALVSTKRKPQAGIDRGWPKVCLQNCAFANGNSEDCQYCSHQVIAQLFEDVFEIAW